MPCLIPALKRSTIKKTKKKINNKISNFTAKTRYLNLKAPDSNVKMQSDKTLANQTYFFLTTRQMELFLNGTR